MTCHVADLGIRLRRAAHLLVDESAELRQFLEESAKSARKPAK